MKTWTMIDGNEIDIRVMTDKHLLNTINMLRRNTDNFNEELNSKNCKCEWIFYKPEELCEEYKNLIEEAKARGL